MIGHGSTFFIRKESKEMKRLSAVLLALIMVLSLAACGGNGGQGEEPVSDIPGLEDGVFTVGMECTYAPYNWAQPDDSNGAVPIKDSPLYANGYDVMTAKAICEANGWQLEVVQLDWDSLVPAVQSGILDAAIAGQSMTSDKMEEVDFAGPYFYASIVCLAKADSKFAQAKGLSDLSGGSCTSQIGTIWYENCLPQIKGADIKEAMDTAPAMLMALESGAVDFVCTDIPTAQGALVAYPDMVILDFSSGSDNFTVSEGEMNIGVSVKKGNTALKEAIDSYLGTLTENDFNSIMAEAMAIQPIE